MNDFKAGDRVKVSRVVKVADIKKVISDIVVVDKAGHYYSAEHWDIEKCDPENWPPLPGDVWEADGMTYHATKYQGVNAVNATTELILHPSLTFDDNALYSYSDAKFYVKHLDDFKALGPVLKFRSAG